MTGTGVPLRHAFTPGSAVREVVPHYDGDSFRWHEHDYPHPLARWHHHPEIEIHLVRASSGSFVIGDEVGAFEPGHVAIVGSGVPHDWMSDVAPGETVPARDAVLQFTAEWIERLVAATPELAAARTLVRESRHGIVYAGATAREAARLIDAIGPASGALRMAHFCALVAVLAGAPGEERRFVLAGVDDVERGAAAETAVEAGLAYVREHLAGDIRLDEAARRAFMSPSSFSKYFTRAAGMSFTEMVRRLRITSACRMLATTDLTVAAVCQASGYRNLANFNRQFRAVTGTTPREYRRMPAAQRPVVGGR